MKKILLSLIFALAAFANLSAAPERIYEVNVIVGKSVDTYPAGMLLQGVTPMEGEEFAKVSRSGYSLHIEGLKEGKAAFKLSLRYGQAMTLKVNVVTRSFVARAQKEEKPQKPKWTGKYELNIPENNFCISFAHTKSTGEETTEQLWARIDDIVISSQEDYDQGWWVFSKYDYTQSLGYSGGFNSDGDFKYYLADGESDGPSGIEAGHAWFDEYAPQPASTAYYCQTPTLFGWDNIVDDRFETGTVMQRMRQFGRDQSFLDRFYRGDEEVLGIKCWVFDMRGKGSYGLGSTCWWIDPATGIALKSLEEDGSGMIVKIYNLDYRDWDVFARPELF